MPRLLHEHLTHSARRYPLREALVCQGETLSYQDLERLSNALACLLLRHGVGPGERVGIYLEKSLQAVTALFGVLKAGAAYVPIDALAPPRRAALMAADCGMRGLVTSPKKAHALAGVSAPPGSTAETFGPFPSLASLILTSDAGVIKLPPHVQQGRWSDLEREAAGAKDAGVEVAESDLAYILYTSGSTGRPKGVAISHRAARAFVDWAGDYFGVTPEDRVSNHAPLHFDLSVFDLFTTLQAGGTVVLVSREISAFPRELADFIQQEEITIWYSVPSVLTQLALHGGLERHRFQRLRSILFAGEVFPVKHLARLRSLIPGASCFNLYGPTETNVCTVYPMSAARAGSSYPDSAASADEPLGDPIPIGRACPYAEVFLWTEEGRPPPPGAPGEIYVGGSSLMDGYLGLPERNAEVLVADPRPGGDFRKKVYRTGDWAREDASGNLIFLGRRDQMVKIRGHRIELGEVEAALLSHPDVGEAVVVAVPDEAAGHVLRAVTVCRPGAAPSEAELKAHCAGLLPPYMIPQSVEFRAALPRTSTGKVDRRELLGAAEP